MIDENEKSLKFLNCHTNGDEIAALVKYYGDNPIDTYNMERAIEKIKEYRKLKSDMMNNFLKKEFQ